MKGNLVIIIDDMNIDLVFGVSNIPVASINKSHNKISELKNLLSTFLNSNSIDFKNIRNVIFVIDFTKFIKDIKKCSFGYIRIGDVTNSKLETKEFMKNISLDIYNLSISDSHPNGKNKELKNFLECLSERGINKIALSSSFSALNPNKEKSLIQDINRMFPNTFAIYPSYSYSSFNYMLRENAMFLDLLLFDTVNNFLTTINQMFNDLGINSSIYFMKGSGTLTSLRIASISPIFTWQSLFSSQLIGASIATGEKDAFVLTNHGQEMKLGIIQNKLPKLSDTFSNFQGLHIPNFFPKSSFTNVSQYNRTCYRFLKSNNPFTGPVPIINFVEDLYLHKPLLTYPIINVKKYSSTLAQGALNSFFQLELTSIVATSDPNIIKAEKIALIDKSKRILEKDKIKLKAINYVYEINPIKYVLKNAFYIKLYVKGDID